MLGRDKRGWFSETAVKDISIVGNKAAGTDLKFHDMFKCDPSAENYGYKSWDGMLLLFSHDVAFPAYK